MTISANVKTKLQTKYIVLNEGQQPFNSLPYPIVKKEHVHTRNVLVSLEICYQSFCGFLDG